MSIFGQREGLVSPSSRLEQIGVLAGIVFAIATRASYAARLKWFQAVDWREVSRMLRGLTPSSKEAKALLKGRIGSDDHGDKDMFQRLRGWIPVQPGENYRAWGFNSFAVLPTFGGAFREDVAQQCGRRMPVSPCQERGTHSGLRLAVADPGAAATVPGVTSYEKDEAARRWKSKRTPQSWLWRS